MRGRGAPQGRRGAPYTKHGSDDPFCSRKVLRCAQDDNEPKRNVVILSAAKDLSHLECVSKSWEMQFRVDLTAFQGAFRGAASVNLRFPTSAVGPPRADRQSRRDCRLAGLLVASQGKATQKCSRGDKPFGFIGRRLRRLPMSQSFGLGHGTVRRRNCASGCLETHSTSLIP